MGLRSVIDLLTPIMGWVAVFSALTFVISLLFIPFIIGKMPADIFLKVESRSVSRNYYSPRYLLFFLLKNVVAIFLLLCGFIMLFIPGQGLLTMLVGLLLLSFPGKQRVILNLLGRQSIKKSLNWIRVKQNQYPFSWPDETK